MVHCSWYNYTTTSSNYNNECPIRDITPKTPSCNFTALFLGGKQSQWETNASSLSVFATIHKARRICTTIWPASESSDTSTAKKRHPRYQQSAHPRLQALERVEQTLIPILGYWTARMTVALSWSRAAALICPTNQHSRLRMTSEHSVVKRQTASHIERGCSGGHTHQPKSLSTAATAHPIQPKVNGAGRGLNDLLNDCHKNRHGENLWRVKVNYRPP